MMKEEDLIEVGCGGVDKVAMVKRFLVGEAETHKADWGLSKPCHPYYLTTGHRSEGLMLNSHTATVVNIDQYAKYLQANIRLQLMQHSKRLLSAEEDLVTPNQLIQ